MGILNLNVNTPGDVGIVPRRVQLLTTDNLATISAAKYLNPQNLQGQAINQTDIFDVIYSYNVSTRQGSYVEMQPAIVNSVITLAPVPSIGNVTLPVVSGDFAVYDGTSGKIKDAGYLPSDAAKTVVAMMNAAVTTNHIAQYADTAGTLKDGGVLGTAAAKAASDNTKANLASINAAPTSGHLVVFTDNVGTIGDGGVLGQAAAKAVSDNAKASVASVDAATIIGNISKFVDVAGTVADAGFSIKKVFAVAAIGGSAAETITDADCTATSVVLGSWVTQANPAQIVTIVPGVGSFVVNSTVDAGVGTFSYIIIK